MAKLEIDNMEYASDTLARAAYSTSDAVNLVAYSEATIKTQGDYSLKAVASTVALSATFTKSFTVPNDLTNVKDLKFDIRSSRTGSNIKLELYSGSFPTGGTITSDASDTSTGIVAHYKMNDNTSNTIVEDTVASNNGTAQQNTDIITDASGKINRALMFNGSSDGVAIYYDLPRNDSSISFWIKTTVADQGVSQFSAGGYNNGNYCDRNFYINSSGIIYFYVFSGNGGSPDRVAGSNVIDGNWHHIVSTWSATSKQIYVDGVLINSSDVGMLVTGIYPMPYLVIGIQNDTGSGIYNPYFNGSLDDFRIYTRILPQVDISALYNAGNGTEDASIVPGLNTIHTFTSDGIFSTSNQLSAEVLVVAGGGGGGKGSDSPGNAGGGGAGGLIHETGYNIAPNNYPITVGTGGVEGVNGEDSIFNDLTAVGGGAGGAYFVLVDGLYGKGSNGGSGGGGAQYNGIDISTGGTGTVGQGNSGGPVTNVITYGGAGGGGASEIGQDTTDVYGNYENGGNGGNGSQISITGSPIYYAGGGGGATHSSGTTQSTGGLGGGGKGNFNGGVTAGVENTGGGGGGGGEYNAGMAGGAGIVIIKYPTSSETLVSEITPNITNVDQWQTIRWNISNIANQIKNNITILKITIINADTENTFYIDNFNIFPQTYDVLGLIE